MRENRLNGNAWNVQLFWGNGLIGMAYSLHSCILGDGRFWVAPRAFTKNGEPKELEVGASIHDSCFKLFVPNGKARQGIVRLVDRIAAEASMLHTLITHILRVALDEGRGKG